MSNQQSNQYDSRLRRLARLLTETPDEGACERCLDRLEEYVEAQLDGRDYTALLPEVARHLDMCVACAECYEALYEGNLAEREGIASPSAPALALDFLARTPAPDTAGRSFAILLGQALQRSAQGLRLTLSPALLEARPGRPAAGAALRGGPDTPLLELALDAHDPAVAELALDRGEAAIASLTLAAFPAPQPGRCEVRVQVALPDREWPDLEGLGIELRLGGAARHAQTDAWGAAVFSDVPLAALDQAELTITR